MERSYLYYRYQDSKAVGWLPPELFISPFLDVVRVVRDTIDALPATHSSGDLAR